MTEMGIRRVEEKLDKISNEIGEVKIDVQRLKTTIDNMPKIDDQKHVNIDDKILDHARRIGNLEANQRWVILAILGFVVQAVLTLVL